MNIGEVHARLRKARKLAHYARVHEFTAEDVANSESARTMIQAYAGTLNRPASIETWKQVIILMTEDES